MATEFIVTTCFRGTITSLRWPCRNNESASPSYQGYDYIAQNLASNGYSVISINANGTLPSGQAVSGTVAIDVVAGDVASLEFAFGEPEEVTPDE